VLGVRVDSQGCLCPTPPTLVVMELAAWPEHIVETARRPNQGGPRTSPDVTVKLATFSAWSLARHGDPVPDWKYLLEHVHNVLAPNSCASTQRLLLHAPSMYERACIAWYMVKRSTRTVCPVDGITLALLGF